MSWRRIEIQGKPVELFEPAELRRFGVVFLHNAQCQPLSFSQHYTSLLEQHRLACVCPFGGATWWSNRILPDYHKAQSAEDYIVRDVGRFVHEQLKWSSPLAIFGISMGGQGALRIAFKYPDLFPVVAAIAPAIEFHEFYGRGTAIDRLYDSKEQCRQDAAPMHLNAAHAPPHVFFCVDPEDQLWHRGADRLREKMAALGAVNTCDLKTRSGGHNWPYFDAMADRAIGFVVAGLDQQSRRLL